jgi:hypothetical protein
MRAKETVECCQFSLMGASAGVSDQNASRNEDCALEVSVGDKDSTENWIRSHLCYILTKNFVNILSVS